jgi:signal recognition particle subunit SRP72
MNALIELFCIQYYTQERYPETIELYNQLINWSGIQDEELQANILAVNACLSMNHQEFNIHKLGESLSYENMYNMACIQLGKGQIPEAEKLLIKARSMCLIINVG